MLTWFLGSGILSSVRLRRRPVSVDVPAVLAVGTPRSDTEFPLYLTLLTLAAYRGTTVNTITRYAVGRDLDGNLKVCRDQNSGPIKDSSREIDRGIATTYGARACSCSSPRRTSTRSSP